MQVETFNYYEDNLPLQTLYTELGTVEYNLYMVKNSINMLEQARTELLRRIQNSIENSSNVNSSNSDEK